MVENSTSRKSLDLNLLILSMFGWWPPDEIRNDWRLHAYHVYSFFAVGFWYVTYMTQEFINILVVWGDIEKMVEASFLLLTHIAQIVKCIIIVGCSSKVKELLDRFDDSIFNKKLPQHEIIVKRYATIVKRDTRVFLSMAFMTIFLWALFPILEEESSWRLPLKAWYPYDTTQTTAFLLTYMHQIITVVIDAFTNISTDTLASGVMVLTSAQLDILIHDLRSLHFDPKKDKGGEIITKRLKECIQHHESLNKFVSDQSEIFQSIYLGQFLVAVIVICITAFQLTLVPISIQFISMILYLACMLMEIFLYCYHGNQIIIKSGEISSAAISCNWYDQNKEYARLLLFMMERSKKPLQVTAGKLFSLSLSTFVKILRSSYSYFAVLQHIHNQ